MLEAFVLPAGEQSKTYCAVVARVLIVVAKAVHVLVPALAVTDAASKGTEAALGLAFDLAQLTLGDQVVILAQGLSRRALAREQCLYLLEILWWGKVATSVGHVVLEPVCLLVALVAIGLWTPERLGQEEGGSGTREGRASAGAILLRRRRPGRRGRIRRGLGGTGGGGGGGYAGCGGGVGRGVGGGEHDGGGETAVGAVGFASGGEGTLHVVGSWRGRDSAGHRRRVIRVARVAVEWFGVF